MSMTASDYFRNSWEADEIRSIIETELNDELTDIFTRLEAIEQKLEQTTNSQNIDMDILPNNSKIAVTKLLYALLSEHGYAINGAKKGATNEQLLNLTERYKVGVSRQTIATWLDRVNTLKIDLDK